VRVLVDESLPRAGIEAIGEAGSALTGAITIVEHARVRILRVP
jgi:hypothetical protein